MHFEYLIVSVLSKGWTGWRTEKKRKTMALVLEEFLFIDIVGGEEKRQKEDHTYYASQSFLSLKCHSSYRRGEEKCDLTTTSFKYSQFYTLYL